MDGKRIRIARESAGLGQKEIADALGVTQSQVSRWENSNMNIRSDVVHALHELTGASYEFLFGDKFDITRAGHEETELLNLYNKLSATDRERVKNFCRWLDASS